MSTRTSVLRGHLLMALSVAMLIGASPALAHTGSGSGGFVGGFTHPVFGPDHVVAMVAVGLWGAFLGAPAIWLLPVIFPLVMAGGGVLGILGAPLPGVEIGIAISAIVLGWWRSRRARHCGSPPCSSAHSRFSTAMPTATSCRPAPTRLPSPSVS
jgi:hydrogenase/urease accessory protein HupE